MIWYLSKNITVFIFWWLFCITASVTAIFYWPLTLRMANYAIESDVNNILKREDFYWACTLSLGLVALVIELYMLIIGI